MKNKACKGVFLSFVLPFMGSALADSITVASWGGSFQEAESKAFFQPAAKKLGITIREDTLNGLADIRVQVKSKAVKWDVAELSSGTCSRASKEGLLEKLDYTLIETQGINPAFVHDDWIGILYFSTVLAYSSEKYGNRPPQNWKDFWNVKQFPGIRAMRKHPQDTLEIALLADGVKPDQLYPLDVDRAFKKLREIKPHITVWWKSGAQSAQLMKDGEVDMISIWNGRIGNAIKDGAKADFTFNQGIINADCLVIPKGAKNVSLAQKAIAQFLSPDLQANLPQYIAYGPINELAFDTGKISNKDMKSINSSPENLSAQIPYNAIWWRDNLVEIQERFDEFLQE